MRSCYLLFIVVIVFNSRVSGASRYAVISGNYEDAIWAATIGGAAGSAAVPTAAEDVIIPSGITVYINSIAEKAKSLTLNGTLEYLSNRNLVISNYGFVVVNSGASILFSKTGLLRGGGNNARGVSVTIHAGANLSTTNILGFQTGTGNTALTGSIAVKPGSVGAPYYDPGVNYTYNSNVAQVTGNALVTANSLTISNSAGVTASGDITVDTFHSDPGSFFDMGTFQLSVTNADHAGILQTQNISATPITPGKIWGGTVAYNNTSAQTIVAGNYYDLDGTGGDRTLGTTADIGIAGVFTPGAGTYTVTNSTVDFNGSGSQNIPEFVFYYLKVSNAGIKYIPASTTVICQTIDVNDDAGVEINADGGGQLDVIQ